MKFLILSLMFLSFNSYSQRIGNFDVADTYNLETGPKSVKSFQYICFDDVGEYLVYYSFASKKVLAFEVDNDSYNNLNQTVRAEFSPEKMLINFTTRNILNQDPINNLEMTLNLKNKSKVFLDIRSRKTNKSYVLQCKKNDKQDR